MSEPDDLFTLRNHFWLGSYQLAIAEGSGLGRLPDSLRIERDEFIYRSYVALGQYSIVLDEVRGRVRIPGRWGDDVGMSRCWHSKWTERNNSRPRPNWYIPSLTEHMGMVHGLKGARRGTSTRAYE